MKFFAARSYVLLVGTMACHGSIQGGSATQPGDINAGGEGGSPPGFDATDVIAADPAMVCTGKLTPGDSPIRRLNRFEYNNSIRDLIGDNTNPADSFPPEEIGNGLGNEATSLGVSRLLTESYLSAAQGIAERATADATKLRNVTGCDLAKASEESCAKTFIEAFGARAFRRPLDAGEKDRLFQIYAISKGGTDFKAGIKASMTAILQMPQFLYRVEFGTPVTGSPGVAKLGQYEMASRLSYMFWATLPDQPLLDAAKAGRLSSVADIKTQVERLLDDPKAHQVTRYFYNMLFGLVGLDRLQRNAANFPTYSAELGPLFRQELEQFIDHVLWQGDGSLATLLTADFSFMNAKLAQFYGVTGPKGNAFEKVTVPAGKRAGFMTSAGVMASLSPGTQSNPVIRGAYLRRKLLCDAPPDPPAALMVAEPKPDPTLTTRERFTEHRTNAACRGCHLLLDPLGFGFEHYDGVGLWRETDNGKPIDATGNIEGTDLPGDFNGAPELMQRLAKSTHVKACHADQWLTFAYGRGFDSEDACTRATVQAAFAKSGGRVRDLLVALATTDAFLYRRQAPLP